MKFTIICSLLTSAFMTYAPVAFGATSPIVSAVASDTIVTSIVNDVTQAYGLTCQAPTLVGSGNSANDASFDVAYACTYNFAPSKQAVLEFTGTIADSQVHLTSYSLK